MLHSSRSAEVNEIIGKTPGWLITWGTSVVFFVLTSFAFLSWIVRYPEVVRAPVEILSAPAEGTYVVNAVVPYVESGNVIIGQCVEIVLDAYPRESFGVLSGTVASVSAGSAGGMSLVNITLTYALRTDEEIDLVFRESMTGFTNIIVGDERLYERLFHRANK